MYKILYILLKNFKRFPLRDSDTFEHTFNDSKLIMIKGGNGLGKSSLINELTPLPSDKNSFNKNGYKEIHIEKNKQIYKLISNFQDQVTFNFILNNEELNTSNNISTQRELVYKHFNITPNTHELFTGAESFTDMSLLSRKKLFNSLSHLNIDSILHIYTSLKEELKVNELLLKSQVSTYQIEEQKLLDKTHLSKIQKDYSRTKEYLEYILDIRSNINQFIINKDQDAIYSNTKSLISRLQDVYTKYHTHITSFPNKDLHRISLTYTSNLSVTNYQLQSFYSSLEKKQQHLKILNNNKESNLQLLQLKEQELINYVTKIQSSLIYLKDINIPIEDTKSSIYKLEVSLPEILRSIPINIDKTYSKEKYDNLLSNKKQLLDKLTNIISTEINLSKEISHLKENHDTISCPKCDYKWSPKDIPTILKQTENKLSLILKEKVDIQTSISSLDKSIEDNVLYFNLYSQYSNIRNSTYSNLKPFWEYIDSSFFILNSPTSILSHINSLNLDISSIETITSINKELTLIRENINSLNLVKDISIEQTYIEIDDISIYISDLQSYKSHLQETVEIVNKITTVYAYIEKLSKAIESSVDELYSSNLSHTMSEVKNLIESDLTKNKIILIEQEKELNQYATIQSTLDKFSVSIQDTKSNIKVLNIILEELSPKNGLIARSVSSLLNIIIGNINNTISSIWNYSMILKIIDIENETLNYRFKLEIEDKLVIDDISKASKGMQEAVNLSFKLVLYKLLGLEEYPLFLDELGSHLDITHTSNMTQLISKLSVSDKFSQIFIITHKENLSFLKNTDIIDLEN